MMPKVPLFPGADDYAGMGVEGCKQAIRLWQMCRIKII